MRISEWCDSDCQLNDSRMLSFLKTAYEYTEQHTNLVNAIRVSNMNYKCIKLVLYECSFDIYDYR